MPPPIFISWLDARTGERCDEPTPQQILDGKVAPYYNPRTNPELKDPAVFVDANPQPPGTTECFEAEDLPAQCMHTFPHFSWRRVRTVRPLPFIEGVQPPPPIPAVRWWWSGAEMDELLNRCGVAADMGVNFNLLKTLCEDPTTLPFDTPLWLLRSSFAYEPRALWLIAHRVLAALALRTHAAYACSRSAATKKRPIYSFGFPGMNALMCRTVVHDPMHFYTMLTRIEI